MTYTVEATGLSRSFGEHVVLDAVDLVVAQGQVVALLGPNGAGKTTLVRILATLLRPHAGTATVAGHDLLTDPEGVKRSISLTGQYVAVDDVLTGRENLEMMALLRGVPRRRITATVTELLARFDLAAAADRRAGTYSGGMKRRLDLAISLITPPALLFLDEPTTGLDPRSREQLWSLVRRLAGDGVSVLLTTQYLEEADQLADTIAMLDHGRVVARGTADELKSALGGEIVRLQFADAPSLRAAATLVGPAEVDERLFVLELATDGSAAAVRAVLGRLEAAGAPAAKVTVHRPSLDDVFLALTGTAGAGPANPAAPAEKELVP
jgi:ABC-2 type transport system ATP-binding protein